MGSSATFEYGRNCMKRGSLCWYTVSLEALQHVTPTCLVFTFPVALCLTEVIRLKFLLAQMNFKVNLVSLSDSNHSYFRL